LGLDLEIVKDARATEASIKHISLNQRKEFAMTTDRPADWKNYEDFAAGIATNRLPTTDRLTGSEFRITLSDATDMTLKFVDGKTFEWNMVTGPHAGTTGNDWYEAIDVADDVVFLDTLFQTRPRDAMTIIVNSKTRRVLAIVSTVAEEKTPGEPQVSQQFLPGVLGDPGVKLTGPEPAPTRDLIGLRGLYRYSPNHVYEHIYLSSERYGWQCLIGVQRGHGDTDLATTYKFDEDQYIFTFREFAIPVSSVFFYNMKQLRSTGKFLGVTSSGAIENNPAGATIQKLSMTFYPEDAQPV
jgi:hypothetical protein